MLQNIKRLLRLERDSSFSTRVIILSLPSAIVFVLLASFGILSPLMALLCYVVIIIFNMFLQLPISYEMQSLRQYIYSLDNQQAMNDKPDLSEKETQTIAQAIDSVHRLWTSKAETLEAQTMSNTAVLDTLPDPIIMLDGEGCITGANLPSRNLLGEELLGRNIDTVFNVNIFISSVEKVLKSISDSESLVFHAGNKLNKRIYAHITKLPWYSKGRAVAVVSIYDISKAMSLEKMQSDFVANASHELRTPLAVISGFIETLQTSAKDDYEAHDTFLNIMKEQADYMSNLIENLLSLSRLEMSQDKKLKDKVDLTEVIDDVTEALKIRAFHNLVNIRVNEVNKIPKIVGDKQEIRQILQNLLDNAIKYAQKNSEVTIELKAVAEIPAGSGQNVAEGKAVSVAINNKGSKINKEDLSRLTEKFYRMQVHKDMKIKGTGLGLAIAKQIIMHHRGNLTVTSTTYNGTTFTIYLPVKQ